MGLFSFLKNVGKPRRRGAAGRGFGSAANRRAFFASLRGSSQGLSGIRKRPSWRQNFRSERGVGGTGGAEYKYHKWGK